MKNVLNKNSNRKKDAAINDISDISSANGSEAESQVTYMPQSPVSRRNLTYQSGIGSPYKASGIQAITFALQSSKFIKSKKDRLKNRNDDSENPAFVEVENVDSDSPRINLHNDVDETYSSIISVSTPSPLVKGRYAKKKDHWNFIQQRRDDNLNAGRGDGDLLTEQSQSRVRVEGSSGFQSELVSDQSSDILS